MAKRGPGSLLELAGAGKRLRGEPIASGNAGTDPNLLSAVGQLLAAATSGGTNSQTQLVAILASALGSVASGKPVSLSPQLPVATKPLGKWDAVVIPTICVGWLKGKQGAMVREIESRSGAVVDIDQSTKELGHCTVNMHGDEEAKRKAYGFVVAEMLKVADQPGSNMDCSAIGTKLSAIIDAKYVGWVKGPKGKVVQDITMRSNTRIDVDQTEVNQGRATINLYGTHENVQYARELLAHEISKVSPEAAAELQAVPLEMPPSSGRGLSSDAAGPSSSLPPAGAAGAGGQASLVIPSSYVGWLKGRQGAMIRDIEAKSGATVDIDQSTKELGHCTVTIRGPEEQKKKAYGFVVAEVMKVSDQSGVPLDTSIGTMVEIPIDGKFVGWVKGPKGKVVQDITARSHTRVDVDQNPGDMSRAVVKIYGTHEGVECARDLIAYEIGKVSPEAAAEISGTGHAASSSSSAAAPRNGHTAGSAAAWSGGQADGGAHGALTIPSSYVGWIKGKQGAMVRDIEARSGAVVDIDQSTKELGHVQVNFRGDEESKRKAFGLVAAEVVKVAEQSGPDDFDCSAFGTKLEIRIDPQFVGWVKGPRGKVVQDISTRSSTRIDMDQGSDTVAVVKIYGTYEGVQAAKEMIAAELSKVSPEAAAEISGAGAHLVEQQPPQPQQLQLQRRAQPQPQRLLASPLPLRPAPLQQQQQQQQKQAAALAGATLSAQQAAIALLTQTYLQQLATVVGGDLAAAQPRYR